MGCNLTQHFTCGGSRHDMWHIQTCESQCSTQPGIVPWSGRASTLLDVTLGMRPPSPTRSRSPSESCGHTHQQSPIWRPAMNAERLFPEASLPLHRRTSVTMRCQTVCPRHILCHYHVLGDSIYTSVESTTTWHAVTYLPCEHWHESGKELKTASIDRVIGGSSTHCHVDIADGTYNHHLFLHTSARERRGITDMHGWLDGWWAP
jgi:hypothetical protein